MSTRYALPGGDLKVDGRYGEFRIFLDSFLAASSQPSQILAGIHVSDVFTRTDDAVRLGSAAVSRLSDLSHAVSPATAASPLTVYDATGVLRRLVREHCTGCTGRRRRRFSFTHPPWSGMGSASSSRAGSAPARPR